MALHSFPRTGFPLTAVLVSAALLWACSDDGAADPSQASDTDQADSSVPTDTADASDDPDAQAGLDTALGDASDDPPDVTDPPDTNLEDDADTTDVLNPDASDTPDAADTGDTADGSTEDADVGEDAVDDTADTPSDSALDTDPDVTTDATEDVATDVAQDTDVPGPPAGACVDTAATRTNVLPGFCPSSLTPPGSYRGTLGSNLNDFAGACGVTSPGRDGALRVAVAAGETLVARYVHAGDGALHLLRSCPVVASCLASRSSLSTCTGATAEVRSAIELRWTNPDATSVQVTLMLDSDALDGPQNFWLDLAIE